VWPRTLVHAAQPKRDFHPAIRTRQTIGLISFIPANADNPAGRFVTSIFRPTVAPEPKGLVSDFIVIYRISWYRLHLGAGATCVRQKARAPGAGRAKQRVASRRPSRITILGRSSSNDRRVHGRQGMGGASHTGRLEKTSQRGKKDAEANCGSGARRSHAALPGGNALADGMERGLDKGRSGHADLVRDSISAWVVGYGMVSATTSIRTAPRSISPGPTTVFGRRLRHGGARLRPAVPRTLRPSVYSPNSTGRAWKVISGTTCRPLTDDTFRLRDAYSIGGPGRLPADPDVRCCMPPAAIPGPGSRTNGYFDIFDEDTNTLFSLAGTPRVQGPFVGVGMEDPARPQLVACVARLGYTMFDDNRHETQATRLLRRLVRRQEMEGKHA